MAQQDREVTRAPPSRHRLPATLSRWFADAVLLEERGSATSPAVTWTFNNVLFR